MRRSLPFLVAAAFATPCLAQSDAEDKIRRLEEGIDAMKRQIDELKDQVKEAKDKAAETERKQAEQAAADEERRKADKAAADAEKKQQAEQTAAASKKAAADSKPSGDGQGVAVIKTDNFKVEVFGTIDLSVGYTSHSLVQSGEMPTSIGPYISGGVRYPRTAAGVPYPASNMSSQVGIFNSALSTSSWGIRAFRDLTDGFKAFIVLDSAFNPATGQFTDQSHNESINSRYPTTAYATSSLNGQLFAKEAVGGFSSDKWGKVSFGRNTNQVNDVLNTYSPLQKAGLFSVYGNGVYGGGGGISENGRIDNSIKYSNKIGDVNLSLLYGFGANGGLKQGNRGYGLNVGYEKDRFGVQLVWEEYKDVIKTATNTVTNNTIDLTTYDQNSLMLVAKYKLTDEFHVQVGAEQSRLRNPTPDVNIPFISNLYGENVRVSTAYVGEVQKINVAHLGFDYDLTPKLNAGLAYMWIGLPRFNSGATLSTHYLGGYIDAWGGLVTYQWVKNVTLYAGALFDRYRGDAFESNATNVYIHDIFTTSTGFRFRF